MATPLPNPFSVEGAKRISEIAGQKLATTPIDASTLTGGSTIQTPAYTPPAFNPSTIVLPPIQNTPEQDALKTKQDDLVGDIDTGTTKLGTKSARKVEIETAQGIPQLNKDIQELYDQANQIDAASVQMNATSEDRLAPTFAIAGEQASIDRQAAAKKAGIAAIATAKQGKLALAQDYVTKSLAAEFDPIEAQINHKKFLLQINMESFSTEEKRRAEQRIEQLDQQKTELAQKRSDRETILGVMLQAAQNGADNATLRHIQGADTPEAATEAAGTALGAAFRMKLDQQQFENKLSLRNMALNEAQLRLSQNKFAFERQQAMTDVSSGVLTEKQITAIDNSPQGKKLKTLGDLKLKVYAYQELVKQYGTSSFGKQKASLDAAFADLKIAYKTAAELGALQGPDIVLLEEALKPATFSNPLSQVFAKLTGRGAGAVNASLDQAIKVIDASGETNVTQLLARNPAYSNSNYVQTLALPFLKPDATTVNVSGQSVPVGSIIQNEQGQRARVNPDGSVTPL